MTWVRVTRPGPRSVAQQAVHRASRGAIPGLFVLALVAAGCGAAGPATSGVGNGAVVPSASAAPAGPAVPDASVAPGASQPRWPGTTVLAVIALGAADGEIRKAGVDLQNAAGARDLKAMWGAADGLARMIDGLMPNLDRLDVYPGTQPIEQLYRKAFPELSAGAKQLRDSITKADANGIVTGSQAIAKGLEDYGPIREPIAALVEQAIVQQRLLVK